MKKKVFICMSILLTLMAVMLFSLTAHAEEVVVRQNKSIINADNCTIDLSVEVPNTDKARGILAVYGCDGRLLSASAAESNQGVINLSADRKYVDIIGKVCVYVWDKNSGEPLMDTLTLLESVSFAAEDVDEERTTENEIYAYTGEAGRITKYMLDTEKIYNGGFYVNGVSLGTVSNMSLVDDLLSEYVFANPTGTVTLADNNSDGLYDSIKVSYYKNVIVDTVSAYSEGETIISFDKTTLPVSEWSVNSDNSNVSYIFMLDGKEINVADLQQGDVLSIAYDVTLPFEESSKYKVLVSRSVVNGMVIMVDENGEKITEYEYTLSDGNVYKFSDTALAENLIIGDEYKIYLDAFGRIVYAHHILPPADVCIIDSVYMTNGDVYCMNIFTREGEKVEYVINDSRYYDYYSYCYDDSDRKLPIQERVYTYAINSSRNEIRLKDKVDYANIDDNVLEYDEKTNQMDFYKLNSETTTVLDISNYGDDRTINRVSTSMLIDGVEYNAYLYDEVNDDYYSFVIIDLSTNELNYKSEFVVYSNAGSQSIDGELKDIIYVYDGDSETVVPYVLSDDVDIYDIKDRYAEGDLMVLKTNSSNEVTGYIPMFSERSLVKSGYDNLFAKATASKTALDELIQPAKYLANAISYNTDGDKKNHYVDFYFGPIVDNAEGCFTIGKYITVTDNNGVEYDKVTNRDSYLSTEEFTYDNDVKIFIYDYSKQKGNRVDIGTPGSILSTSIIEENCIDVGNVTAAERIYINWESFTANGDQGYVNYAFVKTEDDEVTEVYVITPSHP